MMNKMVVSNLVHRPIRSLISMVAIALEVALILLIAGLCYGIMNDSKNRTAGIGADVIVQPPGSSNLAGISGAPVPVKVADILRRMKRDDDAAAVEKRIKEAVLRKADREGRRPAPGTPPQ